MLIIYVIIIAVVEYDDVIDREKETEGKLFCYTVIPV